MTPMLLNKFREAKFMGLTLVELLVVMAVLSLLTAGIVPGLTAQVRRAKILGTQQEITALRDALRLYYEDVDAFPPTGMLQALVDSAPLPWRGPYIISRRDLVDYRQDAWDIAYDYAVTSVYPPRARITSAGPDRSLVTTADDITQEVVAQDLRIAKIRRVQEELEVITRAAQAYAVATGGYPTAIGDLYGAMVPTTAYHITGAQDGNFGASTFPPTEVENRGTTYCNMLWPGSHMATGPELTACLDAGSCQEGQRYWSRDDYQGPGFQQCAYSGTPMQNFWLWNIPGLEGAFFKSHAIDPQTCNLLARVVCVNSAVMPTSYLLDESYRRDAWGNDYVVDDEQFKSLGLDGVGGEDDDDIYP